MVYGVLYVLIIVVSYIIGYRRGRKDGIEKGRYSCAKTSVQLMTAYCCDDCMRKIKDGINKYLGETDTTTL